MEITDTNCGISRAIKSTPVVTGLTPLTPWNQNERKKGTLMSSVWCPDRGVRENLMQLTYSVCLCS